MIDPARLTLGRGRPRRPAYVLLMAVLLCGYLGAGFKACTTATMMQESMPLHVFFQNPGLSMPRRSTLTELVNAVSDQTRQRILDAQVARVLLLGWDDLSVGLLSPHQGNAADSKQLIPMLDEVARRTGVISDMVSVDDGYASRANVQEVRSRGVQVISTSGAKGAALTAQDDWNSDEYTLARDKRSAVEPLMFTLKRGFTSERSRVAGSSRFRVSSWRRPSPTTSATWSERASPSNATAGRRSKTPPDLLI